MKITKHFTFEASHILPKHKGKCSRLHGHSWKLAVCVDGPVNKETGFVLDYGILGEIVKTHVIDHLDHSHLGCGVAITDNAVQGPLRREWQSYLGPNFYPSSENLCRLIFRLLSPFFQGEDNVRLYSITIDETCTSSATWSVDDEYASQLG